MIKINLHKFFFVFFISIIVLLVRVTGQKVDRKSSNSSTNLYFSTIDTNKLSSATVGHTFENFDLNRNRIICRYEFGQLCQALFQNPNNQPYPMDPEIVRELYDTFDVNHDDRLDVREFRQCWDMWIKKILRPVAAYIVIDVQNDFISGSLPTTDGGGVIEPVNRLVSTVNFDRLYYSLDWHPKNHLSFIDNVHLRKLDKSSEIQNPDDAKVFDTVIFKGTPPIRQKLWPSHCVQNTWGAELHPSLAIPNNRILVYKGSDPDIDSYSALFDNGKLSATTLVSDLKSSGITDCYFSGLAYDVCVGASAMDASDLGYRTIIVDDATRGIVPKDIDTVKQKVKDSHGIIVNSNEVKGLVQGTDRRPELAYKLALEIRKKIGA